MASSSASRIQDTRLSSRSAGRSILAIVAGILTNAIPALVVDQILHSTGVYPPWGAPMFDPLLNLLAFSYRVAFAVLGGYVAARLSPASPMRHGVILGCIGILMAGFGAYVAIATMDLGPDWYPLALVVIALPASWFGARLYRPQ